MPKWSTPKGKRQILLIGGLALAGILILVYLSKNKSGSGTGSTSTNPQTPSGFSSSWNSSSTWSGASGNHTMRQPPTRWGGGKPPMKPVKWDADHDKIITGGHKKK